MTIIEDMLEFLKQQEGESFQIMPRVVKVLGIKLKDCDDNYGAIGEHYVVNCKMKWHNVPYEPMQHGTYKNYKAVCLVSKKEFDNYRNKKQTVIWL